MNEFSATSRNLIETKYLDWLCGELALLARHKFEAALPDDCSALMRAKVASNLVSEVRTLIRENAKT